MPGRGQAQHGVEEGGQPWAHRDMVFRGQFVAGMEAGIHGIPDSPLDLGAQISAHRAVRTPPPAMGLDLSAL